MRWRHIVSKKEHWLVAIPYAALNREEHEFMMDNFSKMVVFGLDNYSPDGAYQYWGEDSFLYQNRITRIKIPKNLAIEFCLRFSS